MAAASRDVDLHEIRVADPYPHDYEETVERNLREQEDDARPAIDGAVPDLGGYGTIILGSPVWNVRAPMVMRTFVEAVDLDGRTVIPLVTHAVSGMGWVADEYAEMLPGATMGQRPAVRGEEVQQARPVVENWLRDVGLLQ